MSDLPSRLRSAFAAWGLRSLGDEAADEIERLRSDNAMLRDALDHQTAMRAVDAGEMALLTEVEVDAYLAKETSDV
jgi:hypothetical protein